MKKIVFFDIDGTLLDHGTGVVPESAIRSIRKLKENGVLVGIATGRALCLFRDILEAVDTDLVVSLDGKHVMFKGDVIHEDPISKDTVNRLVDLCNEHNLILSFGNSDRFVVEYEDNEKVSKFMNSICMEYPIIEKDFHLNNDVYQCVLYGSSEEEKLVVDKFDDLKFVRINEYGMNISSIGGLKGQGIKMILDRLGIEKENSYAIGDGLNDICMLQTVGHGIAMGNAHDKLKEVADYVTDNIGDDGIERALKHFKLI